MKFKLILLGVLFASTAAFGSNREIVKERFSFVGKLNYLGVKCSAFIIKHGVLVSAKHCFSHFDIYPEEFEANKLRIQLGATVITGDQVQELVFDRGENDLAYIIYDPEVTQDSIDITLVNPSLEIESDLDIFRIGFPGIGKYENEMVLTGDCKYLGEKDYFPPKITDPGYEGILLDTTCFAWHGDSGGPVMREHNGKLNILGVLSHTFEVDFAGRIKEESLGEDSIGPYVKTSMFSPLSEASDLDFYLRD